MHDLTPADCLAIVFAAILLLYVGFRILIWYAGRAIDCLKDDATYQPRCSTTPEPNRLAIWLAFGVIALVIFEVSMLIARA